MVHNHFGQALNNQVPGALTCQVHGLTGNATICYWGQTQITGPGIKKSGSVDNLYEAGAMQHRHVLPQCRRGSLRERDRPPRGRRCLPPSWPARPRPEERG